MEDDDLGSDLCCPLCGTIQDSYELFTANHGRDGDSHCLNCGEAVPDEEWIQD